MLVSTKWLNDYVKIDDQDVFELAERITRSGIEVDAVLVRGHDMQNVVVGEVMECEKHPEADRLNICQVNVGGEELQQIICGAPNVAKGQKVIAALPGAVLPGNFKIKKAKLRGEASHGMICSLQELGVEGKVVAKEFAEGIYVLPEDAKVGDSALDYIGLDDVVYEFDLTPNRSDALSMLGVAFEVGAILDRPIQMPAVQYDPISERASDYISVQIDAKEQNPLYAAKVVKNVKIGPSPMWMQNVLMSAGIRPHNNVVDITNFVLLEFGQPLHAFDYDKLNSKEIVVRLAEEGEKMTTLDEQERELTASDLVITNGKEPVALAGVMGGGNSEVTENTTTVVIEAAYFDPATVRRTSRRLGLRSDSSARFEKGVDPNRVLLAGERAAQLMAQYAGGEVCEGTVSIDELDRTPKRIILSPDDVNNRLGMKISLTEMLSILGRLNIPTTVENGKMIIDAPTRRVDLAIPEDIVEEIARMSGYDNIPKTLPVTATTPGKLTNYQAKRRIVRRYLEGAGLYQAITYSLTSEAKSQRYAIEEDTLTKLMMPMSEEHSTLRQSLVPSLLDVATYNVARRNETVLMYETGSVYLGKQEDGLPREVERVAAVMTGDWLNHMWQGETKKVDFFVAKGVVEGLFAELGLAQRVRYEAASIDGMHPGRTAHVLLDDVVVGFVGQVHPTVQKEQDLKDTFVFELNLHAILHETAGALVYEQVSRYPSISRDIALVVKRDTTVATLQEIIQEAGGKLLKHVRLFDLYEGDNVAADEKSVAFSLTYFDSTRTLTDEEVVQAHDKVLKALTEKANATLRA
ncbi:phenylalanine--tRNA ligase subunit beta [Savagea sp. SN6]|uniref:Phenylalanine--tRNA ligase beta subunit n=1 Tax=Savagea serpentis TaxID=2785297 RepID=A0A8J7G3N0_9BACL|nr:phenylalanine--tRNA ligase subunit beta [Savagea serpentis]MBF4501655.1 phenylalanine--tRNA ligase subunit beta [Savagea serpentis]